MEEGKKVGKVFKFFSNIGVAAIGLSDILKVGDKIKIKGATTDFEEVIKSMQIRNQSVSSAKAGDEIGIKLNEKVRPNDVVYKL